MAACVVVRGLGIFYLNDAPASFEQFLGLHVGTDGLARRLLAIHATKNRGRAAQARTGTCSAGVCDGPLRAALHESARKWPYMRSLVRTWGRLTR
eukprot:7034737-Alexandrium_andersonii.AAC.1